jgi:hypothetical protein
MASTSLSTFPFLPPTHLGAFARLAKALAPPPSDPYRFLNADLVSTLSALTALLSSLSRPHTLIASLQNTQKAIDRHRTSLRRSDRWPMGIGLLDEARKGLQADAQGRLEDALEESRSIACELRYTQQTVASELAGWQVVHRKMERRALRKFAEEMVVREKERLEGMRRAVRGVVDLRAKGL